MTYPVDPTDRSADSPAFTREEVAALVPIADRARQLLTDAQGQDRAELVPPLPAESGDGHRRRLLAPSSGVFGATVDSAASTIASAVTIALPDPLAHLSRDADGKGSSLPSLLASSVAASLVQGGCFLILSTRLPGPFGSRQEAAQAGQAATLSVVPRVQVINWSTDARGRLSELVVEEERSVSDGRFRRGCERVYRHLFPGGFAVYRVNGSKATLIEEGPGPETVPAVFLGWDSTDPATASAGPLVAAGEMAAEAHRLRSNLVRLTELTALPVAVRTGAVASSPTGNPQPVVLGPDSLIDLPENARFEWIEIGAQSLTFLAGLITSLEDGVRNAGARVLQARSGESAAGAHLRAHSAAAGLGSFLSRVCSAIQSALQMAAQLEGLPLVVDADVATYSLELLSAADPTRAKVAMDLHNAGLLSSADTLKAILASGALPLGDANPEDLLRDAMAEHSPPAPRQPDPNANPADVAQVPQRITVAGREGALAKLVRGS